MQKSRARRTLEELLSAAADLATKADLASRLAKVADSEGKERARRRRAKAAKPEPAQPVLDDGDVIFELDPPAVILPQPAPTSAPHRQILFEGIVEEEAVERPAPVAPQNGAGWTRVISAMEPLEIFDRFESRWVPSTYPRSSVGDQPADEYWMLHGLRRSERHPLITPEDGWSFEVRDKTGQMRVTNTRERAEERQQQRQDDEIANAWGW